MHDNASFARGIIRGGIPGRKREFGSIGVLCMRTCAVLNMRASLAAIPTYRDAVYPARSIVSFSGVLIPMESCTLANSCDHLRRFPRHISFGRLAAINLDSVPSISYFAAHPSRNDRDAFGLCILVRFLAVLMTAHDVLASSFDSDVFPGMERDRAVPRLHPSLCASFCDCCTVREC